MHIKYAINSEVFYFSARNFRNCSRKNSKRSFPFSKSACCFFFSLLFLSPLPQKKEWCNVPSPAPIFIWLLLKCSLLYSQAFQNIPIKKHLEFCTFKFNQTLTVHVEKLLQNARLKIKLQRLKQWGGGKAKRISFI